ncbi:hypothetical protein B7463_g3249, partial [Scytalidium lignicola]
MVRAVTREVRELDKDVSNLLQSYNGSFDPAADPAMACTLLVDHLCMRRNKRCLLAYHRTRTDKLEEMIWNGTDVLELAAQQQQQQQMRSTTGEGGGGGGGGGGVSSSSSTDLGSLEGSSSSLSPEEEEYVRQYSDLLSAYKGQWTDIDLTGSLQPPRDLFIDVRVLKDAGEIQTEYGQGADRDIARRNSRDALQDSFELVGEERRVSWGSGRETFIGAYG